MAKRTTSRSNRRKAAQPQGIVIRPELVGTILLILAGVTLLSLFTPNQGPIVVAWLQFLGVLIGWGRYV
ncbi:MAG: hypothetical protein R3264_15230, partial [Anaerolineae bacterium]|nr:hypothetical protein [Anaerolineae bacterium]